METLRALVCTILVFSLKFNLFGQVSEKNHELMDHVFGHINPEMTKYQIDSLFQIAEKHKKESEANIQELIFAAQKANKTFDNYKSDACEMANWGFENGNTSNWVTSGCVELENGGMDSYSNLPKVYNGNHSLKLSNDMNYSCINSAAARTYSVPASGQTFITIHFAVSIFNYPHAATEAANFNFNLYDDQMNVLPCPSYQAYFSYDNGPVGIPSLQQTTYPATSYNPLVAGDLFYNSNVSYSNWHHVTIDLSSYAGTDVTMVFENRWCSFNLDWIYTYIEVDCPINTSIPVPICLNDHMEMCAPQGMLATYTWEFNGSQLNTMEPCITANIQGTYTLEFRPNYLECADTSYEINYELIDKTIADFSVEEFCIGQPIIIDNQSLFGTDYKWLYNDEEFFDYVPNLDYMEGEDNLTLITMTGLCSDTITIPLIAHKIPIAKFDFVNECLGIPYKIKNQSTDPENGPLEVNWLISNDYQSSDWNPDYTPQNDEGFIISLNVSNQYGCSTGFQANARAHPLPIAAFQQSDTMIKENEALVHFIETSSSDVNSWNWFINEQNVYDGSDFYHEFYAPGIYQVSLIVYNDYACSDTTYNQVTVNPSLNIFVPNTFTPNGDGMNQLFFPVISGSNFDRKSYSFLIYNRWGEIVFQTNDIMEGWDGINEGKPCMPGTYSWEINYLEKNKSAIKHLDGHVNLIR